MTESLGIWVHVQVKFWRLLAIVSHWLQALDYTSFDYTQDRISRLERIIVELKEEVSRIRASCPRDSESQ